MNVEHDADGAPFAGDVRDALRRGDSMLRALGELLDGLDVVSHAVETVALELEARQAGPNSILAQRDRADAARRAADAERQGGAS